jgi:hypothetical protein
MSNIRDLIEQKNRYENKLKTVLTDFLYKYITKIYKTLPDKRLKTFQKTLLYIPEWDQTKKDKVYDKFLVYLKNKSINEFDLESLLENIISLNVKIILIFSDNYKNDFITIPEGNDFLFRCIRYTAKAYYDCPSQIEEPTSSQKLMLQEIIDWNIQKFIPLKKIFDYKEHSSQFSDNDESEYDGDNEDNLTDTDTDSSQNETEDLKNNTNKINAKTTNFKIEKEQNSEEIKYLSENEINEYYQSDSDENKVDNIKHITIKKKSKKF